MRIRKAEQGLRRCLCGAWGAPIEPPVIPKPGLNRRCLHTIAQILILKLRSTGLLLEIRADWGYDLVLRGLGFWGLEFRVLGFRV